MLPHHSPFAIKVVHEDGSLLLALTGELDHATAPVLGRVVRELLSPHLGAVTLDLAGLEFIDLTGLRALLNVKGKAEGVQADFRLQSVSDLVRRLIALVDFDELEAVIEGDPAASAV